MKLQTVSHWQELSHTRLEDKIAVVIDVFRATSVMVKALADGAEKIIVARSVDDAFEKYATHGTQRCLLAGERHMHAIEGFHLGNSPQSYTPDIIRAKTVILTTTNGTKAVEACHSATEVAIGAFLNCAAVAQWIARQGRDVVIVCAGTGGRFSLDDALCAGFLINTLETCTTVELSDFAWSLKQLANHFRKNKIKALEHCRAYTQLVQNGYGEDVTFCLRDNVYDIVPKADGNTIRL